MAAVVSGGSAAVNVSECDGNICRADLGLTIVEHGAQFHGAQEEMESEPGSGTRIRPVFVNHEKTEAL